MSGGGNRARLVLFANHDLTSSVRLTAAALKAATSRPDLEVVGIVDGARSRPGRARLPRELALRAGRRLSDPRKPPPFAQIPLFVTLSSLARRYRIPLLAPREKTVNDPEFVKRLGGEIRPDASLVLMVDQVFRTPLLEACGEAVNYHNAALPSYRGIGGPEWSFYRGDRRAGYTFHRLIEGLDAGPILVEGSVEIPAGSSFDEVERAKTIRAEGEIDHLFDLISQRDPGAPQEGEASMFNRTQLDAIRDVGDGSSHTHSELERRLRAFGTIKLTQSGEVVPATALRLTEEPSALVSADGVRFAPSRVMRLRPSLFRLYRATGLVWTD